jgi:hypothetical protein
MKSAGSGRTRPGRISPRKEQENYTMLKQISLAALAATFITGSAALAHAESNVSGVDGGGNTSAGLEHSWNRGPAAFSMAPSASMNAYNYAPERRLHRSHTARAKHNR